ncbi:hypothetical protein GGP41_000638 [Bipolaris sorokiniana]|uniref:Uncharacterized protein n=1 Tax=Cochliobolus sativus TaxID=45130 RepID=A0A8H6DZ50_COCSA|nr:hypothetical protein GGP41_000638 [Bipolaris sorokiniana]
MCSQACAAEQIHNCNGAPRYLANSPAATAPPFHPITCLVKKCHAVYQQWSSRVNGVVVTFK